MNSWYCWGTILNFGSFPRLSRNNITVCKYFIKKKNYKLYLYKRKNQISNSLFKLRHFSQFKSLATAYTWYNNSNQKINFYYIIFLLVLLYDSDSNNTVLVLIAVTVHNLKFNTCYSEDFYYRTQFRPVAIRHIYYLLNIFIFF